MDAQNAGNEKIQHTERNLTMADLLKNSKICPEESIYQRTELCTGKAGGGGYMNVFEAVKAAVTTWQAGSLHALYDKSNGFYRRQLLLTTREQPADRKDDPFLINKLRTERDSIFLWALEGLHRLIKNNYRFTISQRTVDKTWKRLWSRAITFWHF